MGSRGISCCLISIVMKLLVVATAAMIASVTAKASPGGYTLKGGVYDFKRPLDYKADAVNAGGSIAVHNCLFF